MLLPVHPKNPEDRKIEKIVNVLKKGGVIIYPTDSVYAFACDIFNKKAIDRICALRHVKPEKSNFSISCADFSELSEYAKQLDSTTFRVMRQALPGPFTFILEASQKAPVTFRKSKKTIGVRIQDAEIPSAIVKKLGNPIVTASIKAEDEVMEYLTDPSLIQENFSNLVDLIIDGGIGKNTPTTVIDCSKGQIEIIRQGIGIIES